MISASSTPSLTEFDPFAVPYQARVVADVRSNYDYRDYLVTDRVAYGTKHEFLLSGSVGSAKSILLAHLGVTHCMMYPRARHALCRQSMPDLKETILAKVLEHMEGDMVEGEDYEHNETKGKIEFSNGSEIISVSWADKKFKRFRSKELSSASVEELTENDDKYWPFYDELYARVGRLPHIPEAWIGCATNPDDPSHPAYTHFVEPNLNGKKHPTRHVYYSVTTDNKFLPPAYVQQLLGKYDPKLARRMIYGEWLAIMGDVVYHTYSPENFVTGEYVPMAGVPIRVCFDFNIGEGKPMSATAMQYLPFIDEFHYFDEFVVEGARTSDILDEMHGRGLFEWPVKYIIHGDASGASNNTRSKKSDYDLIRQFLSNTPTISGKKIDFEMRVPTANPPVRKRHNMMNAYCKNALGARRMKVYASCPVLDKGMRLTKLKPGGNYIEDDSKAYQHVTTAAGYGLMSTLAQVNEIKQSTQEL